MRLEDVCQGQGREWLMWRTFWARHPPQMHALELIGALTVCRHSSSIQGKASGLALSTTTEQRGSRRRQILNNPARLVTPAHRRLGHGARRSGLYPNPCRRGAAAGLSSGATRAVNAAASDESRDVRNQAGQAKLRRDVLPTAGAADHEFHHHAAWCPTEGKYPRSRPYGTPRDE